MEVLTGAIRGMGKSVTTMIISLLGVCAFRILWIKTVFVRFPTLECVYLSYPISWIMVICANLFFLIFYYKRLLRENHLQFK